MKYAFAIVFLFLSLPDVAQARPNRVDMVPHGSAFGCDLCHTSAGGLTDFGFDSFTYTTNGNVSWSNLSKEDSDQDGYTNGVELGDPNGTWKAGNAEPSGSYTDPSDANDNLCGDGKMQANEDCEGGDLQGATCDSLNLGTGTLKCTNRCVYDVASCEGCGNGVKQSDEECDGSDLGGATCDVLGFEGGSISCGTNCRLITSACTGDGHGSVSPMCGNGTMDVGENCDRSDIGAATCQSLGYSGGFLGCSGTCTFDVSNCTSVSNTPATGEPTTNSDSTTPQGGLAPDADDERDVISFEGRACSSVGADASLWLLVVGIFFGRRWL